MALLKKRRCFPNLIPQIAMILKIIVYGKTGLALMDAFPIYGNTNGKGLNIKEKGLFKRYMTTYLPEGNSHWMPKK